MKFKAKRSKTTLIRDCINKRIAEYLHHWRFYANNHHARVIANMRVLMVKTTRLNLFNYFNFWKMSNSRSMKKRKFLLMDHMIEEKFSSQNDLVKTKQYISAT